ncbi:SRPBCC domain-containing protein [Henriciella sp.]|uniref:SRPBCC family protein n=1 Tax=Henriciella sp. TaxID=1968823 RepID=UPI002606682D|nr:SRPBCC domain-containing protein [Henriciella sp.]
MSDTAIVKTIILKAPIEKVWTFLTVPEKLANWFHETDRALGTAGTEFVWYKFDPTAEDRTQMWGRVLESDPPKRLVHTFTHHGIDELETTVTWELTPITGGTHLKLTHEGLEHRKDQVGALGDHDKGWEGFLSHLRFII